ncbi:MAG TPA: hypothetical protein VIM11_15305 [Tepidisphaeraceae bacterium]|jgi:hypothetical protein
MRSLVISIIAVAVGSAAMPAIAAEPIQTINFDTLPASSPGIALGSPYEALGIVFSSPGFLVKNNTNLAVAVPSLPNFLDLAVANSTTASLHFVQPGNTSIPAVVDYFAFNNAGLTGANFGWYNGITVTTRDILGKSIGVFTIDPYGPNATRPVFQTSISEPGIHSIDFQLVVNPFSSNALAPIDDISFGQVTPVPEPTAVGILLTSILLRRRKNARAAGAQDKKK